MTPEIGKSLICPYNILFKCSNNIPLHHPGSLNPVQSRIRDLYKTLLYRKAKIRGGLGTS